MSPSEPPCQVHSRTQTQRLLPCKGPETSLLLDSSDAKVKMYEWYHESTRAAPITSLHQSRPDDHHRPSCTSPQRKRKVVPRRKRTQPCGGGKENCLGSVSCKTIGCITEEIPLPPPAHFPTPTPVPASQISTPGRREYLWATVAEKPIACCMEIERERTHCFRLPCLIR
ncbi:hypothetical protein VTI74DRAFT_10856 [Chaetomium olivicolor]